MASLAQQTLPSGARPPFFLISPRGVPRVSRVTLLLALVIVAAVSGTPVLTASLTHSAPATILAPVAPAAQEIAPAAAQPLASVADPTPWARPSAMAVELADAARVAKAVTVPPVAKPKPVVQSKPRVASVARPRATTHRTTATHRHVAAAVYTYRGTNHVWIPSLGINRAVYSYPCSRTTTPGYVVYRWGCAGTNNVYLMAHAGGPFAALNSAYYSGRLRVGMKVMYANSSGVVHTYSVIWWKVVLPTTAASWAWASLSRPSMTLQTCVGANSAYRLMVRLVQVA
ncbi:MAG: sortase [Chloroflexi bacterium]|nr:MAG: sortase [Chloroflexota bacterium]